MVVQSPRAGRTNNGSQEDRSRRIANGARALPALVIAAVTLVSVLVMACSAVAAEGPRWVVVLNIESDKPQAELSHE